MKIAQYTNIQVSRHSNKSFQREIWENHWDNNSIEDLTKQLYENPIYWRLKKIIKKNQTILEAGCGLSQWVYCLSRQGYKILGVDIARKTINKIKKNYPKINLHVADVEDLPYKDNSFDVYLSFGVVEHFIKGPSKVLKEAHRVTKSGGLLYITVPYLNIPRYIKYNFFTKQNGKFYQYLYSEGEIITHIKEAGFKIERVGHYDFINAVKKDVPFFYSIKSALNNFKRVKKQNLSLRKLSSAKQVKLFSKEPNFRLQKLLYLIDSYIILVEARKI
ncbi:MAG: S-adenosylmethionine (SAM)-dependent methyltransferase [uncultured bacterium]|nr:MAG: S-adenosylmethionine (SAM)-dependent methyltransferase [uncultured bacterium]